MSIVVKSKTQIEECTDCGSAHLGIKPCGYPSVDARIASMKTVRLATEWMPSRTAARQTMVRDDNGVERPEQEYYDDEALTAMFDDGLTGKERKELLMEETKGVGYATAEDIKKHPELVDAHFLGDPADEVGEVE